MIATTPSWFTRWWRFNLVGAMGMAVQLGTLARLHHLAPEHYLIESAIAVELAVLHNFTWHVHYTWSDRPCFTHHRTPHPILICWLRFQISNGALSLFGNLLLMRLLVSLAHLPVLLSNGISIACCSIANFMLSQNWAFAGTSLPAKKVTRRCT